MKSNRYEEMFKQSNSTLSSSSTVGLKVFCQHKQIELGSGQLLEPHLKWSVVDTGQAQASCWNHILDGGQLTQIMFEWLPDEQSFKSK